MREREQPVHAGTGRRDLLLRRREQAHVDRGTRVDEGRVGAHDPARRTRVEHTRQLVEVPRRHAGPLDRRGAGGRPRDDARRGGARLVGEPLLQRREVDVAPDLPRRSPATPGSLRDGEGRAEVRRAAGRGRSPPWSRPRRPHAGSRGRARRPAGRDRRRSRARAAARAAGAGPSPRSGRRAAGSASAGSSAGLRRGPPGSRARASRTRRGRGSASSGSGTRTVSPSSSAPGAKR